MKKIVCALMVCFGVFCWANEGTEPLTLRTSWLDIALDILAILAIIGGGTGIRWIVQMLSVAKWVKKLKLESFIIEQSKIIVRWVENWARGRLVGSEEKLQEAVKALIEKSSKSGIKVSKEEAEKYIESALNELKADKRIIEYKKGEEKTF